MVTLSVQELSDRFEIQDLLVGYCYAVDARDFDALDQYFVPSATIDYSEMVGFRGNLAETKEFLRNSFSIVTAAQHAVSTTRYEFDQDRCRTKTVCTNPMTVSNGTQEDTVTFGLWYIHDLIRTDTGWKIERLYEEKCYQLGVPDWLKAKVT